MDMQTIQLVAGSLSSVVFISSNLPMLVKAYKTKDLSSYSLTYLVLNIIGDAIYWLYIGSLPPGPIWFMHTFYTITSILMLAWYLRYQHVRSRMDTSAAQGLA